MNLTRHVDYDTFLRRDLVDTVTLAEYIPMRSSVLDIGTGGGVPGVLMGILRPDLAVCVCDSVAKKANAVRDIVQHLAVPIEVHAGRAEELLSDRAFDVGTVRAVARLDQLLRMLKPHWRHIGQLLLVKGPKWIDERAQARHSGLLKSLDLRRLCEYQSGAANSVILQLHSKT
jgi:16S rRNA (guanine527-N7)-methyltransferase